MNAKRLKKLKEMIIENEGLTLTNEGEIASLKDGFMVSLYGYEKVIKDIKYLELAQVKSYLKKAKKLDAFVGFWIDDDKVYLDISVNIGDKKEALRIARENKQLAIFDCSNMETIRL